MAKNCLDCRIEIEGPENKKRCKECQEKHNKEKHEYYKTKEWRLKRKANNKMKAEKKNKEIDEKRKKQGWPRKYNQSSKLSVFETHLRLKYNWTLEDYNKTLNDQGGVCGVCGTSPPFGNQKRLFVDHCHETGKVRGLLCPKCNQIVGNLESVNRYINQLEAYFKKAA